MGETLKVGKKDGSQELAELVAGGVVEVVEGLVWSSVPVGLALTGRSGWSVGLPIREVTGAVGTAVVVPAIVVVAISAWLSSSCSSGMGRRVALEASIDSPHNFRCQSTKVPLCSLIIVSLTITVQVPIPDSPLSIVS